MLWKYCLHLNAIGWPETSLWEWNKPLVVSPFSSIGVSICIQIFSIALSLVIHPVSFKDKRIKAVWELVYFTVGYRGQLVTLSYKYWRRKRKLWHCWDSSLLLTLESLALFSSVCSFPHVFMPDLPFHFSIIICLHYHSLLPFQTHKNPVLYLNWVMY